jgi:predicted amidohydrolase
VERSPLVKNTRVAAVQFEHAAGDKKANLDKIRSFVEAAAEQQVEIAVFPECCITGYWFLRNLPRVDIEELAEPVPEGAAAQFISSLAAKHRMTIGAGLVEITPEGTLHNTYLVAMPDGQSRRHRKLHTFVSEHMESGSEYTVFDTPQGCRAGVLTCYDNNIGENARITALLGAELLLAPHQTGGVDSKDPHVMGLIDRGLWDRRRSDPEAIEAELRGPKGRGWLLRWLPTRAHDNGLFLIFSNGVGVDDSEVRTGNAMIIDPYGRILAETWKADDDMVIADLEASLLDECTGRRWIRTRRPDLYGTLAESTGSEQDTRSVRFDAKGV